MIGKSSKWHRPVVYSLLIVILIFAGSVTWVALGYKKFIKKNISAWVSKATDSMYQASIVDISINVFTRKIIITGIKVWPDTNIINNFKETGRTHNISVTVVIPKLQLNSIKWQKFVSSKELVCGETLIWQPEVLIVSKQRKPDSSQIQPEKKKSPAIKKNIRANY